MNKTKIRIIKSKIKYKSYKTKSPEYLTEYNNKTLDGFQKCLI